MWRTNVLHNYPNGGTANYVSSMIDADERDKHKAWRKVGAVFAAPVRQGYPASIDAVSGALEYSIDGGASWVAAGAGTWATNTADPTYRVDTNIGNAAAVSTFLQLRWSWASVSDWAPVLVGLWVEYELLDSPARRRRWSFTVSAEDQTIDRDGKTLTRTGREMIAELWDHWEDGTTIPLRDLDFDTDAVERQVRIVGITERVPAPREAGRWGNSAVSLVLVEV